MTDASDNNPNPAAEVSSASAAEVSSASAAEVSSAPAAEVSSAPEKYEAFKTPDGVMFDAPVVEAFAGVAKELGLTQDKAQALIDKVAPALTAQTAAAFEQMKTSLLASAKADAEIGGDKFDSSVSTAKLAIGAYFAPDFADFLNVTGLGNHPEMIRGLAKAGAALKQDGHVPGGRSPTGEVNAKSFYNNSDMNE